MHFLVFSGKCCECKLEKRDGYGKLKNGHGQNVVKSVGTLSRVLYPAGTAPGHMKCRGLVVLSPGFDHLISDYQTQ